MLRLENKYLVSYHPATIQAPNLKHQESFSIPLNYTGDSAPFIQGAREKQRSGDASDRKDNANKIKALKTSDAHVHGSF
ncbi:hypothetical protein BELL_0293g00080 [Botrytis elliptica]|uniref:Uncharacterized protein n=1 Tax=Botrytis elliptica TaxID=278938 RepID=A0A4Z1JZC5_9HELO|nr:hypothetical protein BELL_0293g00080 [Botrytis elliptica]